MSDKPELDLAALRRDFEEDFTPTTIGGVEWMRRGRNGDYRNPSTQSAWQGYVACAARRTTIQPTAANEIEIDRTAQRAADAILLFWATSKGALKSSIVREIKAAIEISRAPVAPADAVRDAERLNKLIDWYLRGGARSEVHEHGHIEQTTREHIIAWLDAATPKEPAK